MVLQGNKSASYLSRRDKEGVLRANTLTFAKCLTNGKLRTGNYIYVGSPSRSLATVEVYWVPLWEDRPWWGEQVIRDW